MNLASQTDHISNQWLDVLRFISDGTVVIQNVSRFVPGHEPPGTLADLQRLSGYIQDVQQIAWTLTVEGKPGQAEIDSNPITREPQLVGS